MASRNIIDRQTQERRKLTSVLKLYLARTTTPVTQLVLHFLMPDNVMHVRNIVELKLRESLCLDTIVVVVDEAFEAQMVNTALDAPGLLATAKNLRILNANVVNALYRNAYSQLRVSAYNHRLYANNKPSNIEAPQFECGRKHTDAISSWNYDSHDPGRQYQASYLKRVFGIEMKPCAKGMCRDNFTRTRAGAGHAPRGMYDELALNGGRGMAKC